MAIVTTAWKYPGTVVNGVSGETGTNDWASPANITADDGSEASSAFAGTRSRTLRASNFGFTTADIPAAATINGIEVRIERRESDANRISDVSLYIVPDKSGGNVADRVGDNKADTVTKWPTSVAVANYGSSSDKWSSGLTPAQAVSSSFAIDFEAQSSLGGIGYVDFLQVRITWEMPTVTGTADIAEGADSAAGGSAYVPALDLDFITSETPDPRITFSGGANGTRVNSAGQIVAASAPRYDYDPVTHEARGLLIEEARTNLATKSEFQSGVGDASARSSVTATTFDGLFSNTGLSFQPVVNPNTAYAYKIPGNAAGTAYTLSVFVRMDDGGPPVFGSTNTASSFNDFALNVAGVVTNPSAYTVEDYGDGLYRVWYSVTAGADNQYTGVIKYATNSARGFSTSGWQFEQGSFPTSYIPTGASQVTRAADQATISGGNFSGWFNPTEGAIFLDYDIAAVPASNVQALMIGSSSTDAYYMRVQNVSLADIVFAGGSSQAFLTVVTTPPVPKTLYRQALAYAANDFAGCVNGGAVVTDNSGNLPAPTALYLGNNGGGQYLNGHIRRFRYFNQRLPNALLQTFTTAITGAGSLTEANDNAAGTGRVKVKGAAAIVEGDDVSAGAGETGIHLVTPAGRIAAVGASRLSNRTAR